MVDSCVFTIFCLIYAFTVDVIIKNKLQINRLRLELERLHEENHKLKHLLDEISERYNDLQSRVLLARPTQVEGLQQHEVLNCLNHKMII